MSSEPQQKIIGFDGNSLLKAWSSAGLLPRPRLDDFSM